MVIPEKWVMVNNNGLYNPYPLIRWEYGNEEVSSQGDFTVQMLKDIVNKIEEIKNG